jgi:hypothetical protein
VTEITEPGNYRIKLYRCNKPQIYTVIEQDGVLGIWFNLSKIFTPLSEFRQLSVVERVR